MAFGFDTTLGYVSPTFEQLLQDFADKYEAATGIVVDLEQPSPTLDLLRTMARIAKAQYDDGAGTYGSGFIGSSSEAALQNLISPFIGPPLAATSSTVVLPLAGVALTNVPAGSAVTLSTDGPGADTWVLLAPVVIPGDGTFAYSQTGPKSAGAGSAWTIATPVAGWATAGPNVADASQGRAAETELEYRARFTQSQGSGLILAAVLAVPGVTSASIFENPTDIPDAFWGATHWFEVLVQGGDDTAIAEAIQATRCLTNQTLGNVTIAVTALGFPGDMVDIRFSRPTLVNVWIDITITKGEGYSSDTSAAAISTRVNAITDYVVAWGDGRSVGDDLYSFQVAANAYNTPTVPGIATAVALIGTSDPPLLTEIVAGPRDLLVFDASRIDVFGA